MALVQFNHNVTLINTHLRTNPSKSESAIAIKVEKYLAIHERSQVDLQHTVQSKRYRESS